MRAEPTRGRGDGSCSSARTGAPSTRRSSDSGRTPGRSLFRSWRSIPRPGGSSAPPTPSRASTPASAARSRPTGISPPRTRETPRLHSGCGHTTGMQAGRFFAFTGGAEDRRLCGQGGRPTAGLSPPEDNPGGAAASVPRRFGRGRTRMSGASVRALPGNQWELGGSVMTMIRIKMALANLAPG